MTVNRSASVLARLLNLAKQRGDDYNLLLNRLALERQLYRVVASPHADRLLLKGALLFSFWYHRDIHVRPIGQVMSAEPDGATGANKHGAEPEETVW